MLQVFLDNFLHNLFKPLLLFFYAGFAIPLLNVKFEFPKVIYQGLTIYLLLAIGWHGGEELAGLPPVMYGQAAGFMLVGFVTNTLIGCLAYAALRGLTKLRNIDAATVAGYYGSDSAGTFVTCLGVLTAANIAYAPFMPVMLAIMEIPGCLVALFLVSRLRRQGMDECGNMPGEIGYGQHDREMQRRNLVSKAEATIDSEIEGELVGVGAENSAIGECNGRRRVILRNHAARRARRYSEEGSHASSYDGTDDRREEALAEEDEISLQHVERDPGPDALRNTHALNAKLLHEVFLNPGIYLLFAGIVIGFVSRLQGVKVIAANDHVFVDLFQGLLCLFLLEMGMTAARKLKDLKAGGWTFIAFGLLAPNVFATLGMFVAHLYSIVTGVPFEVGTYVLFAVLCGASSYIAVPAVQRLAIPEASPTLPLAASLGLTFSYNVTIGIPLYMVIATFLTGGR